LLIYLINFLLVINYIFEGRVILVMNCLINIVDR